MKVLVTGATGFVGRHLLPKLQLEKHELTVLCRDCNNNSTLEGVRMISLSNSNWKKQVQEADPEVVIHLASHLTSSDDEVSIAKLIEVNITLGINLLDALKPAKLKAFINTGTSAEYNANGLLFPAYLYAATKTAFKPILLYYQSLSRFKIIHVVPYTIYGGLDSKKKLIDYIYDSTNASRPIDLSPGEQILDFIHISDVVNFYVNLINNLDKIPDNYSDVHLGTGKGTTPKNLACIFEKFLPETKINWGGIPYRATDTMYAVAPYSKLCALIGWHHKIDIQTGVKQYIKIKRKN